MCVLHVTTEVLAPNELPQIVELSKKGGETKQRWRREYMPSPRRKIWFEIDRSLIPHQRLGFESIRLSVVLLGIPTNEDTDTKHDV